MGASVAEGAEVITFAPPLKRAKAPALVVKTLCITEMHYHDVIGGGSCNRKRVRTHSRLYDVLDEGPSRQKTEMELPLTTSLPPLVSTVPLKRWWVESY